MLSSVLEIGHPLSSPGAWAAEFAQNAFPMHSFSHQIYFDASMCKELFWILAMHDDQHRNGPCPQGIDILVMLDNCYITM